jgi:hypothetical protein
MLHRYHVERASSIVLTKRIVSSPQCKGNLGLKLKLRRTAAACVGHDNHFYEVVRNYAFQHHVKPGLTGWMQVNGYRGPTPTEAEIRNRVECESIIGVCASISGSSSAPFSWLCGATTPIRINMLTLPG